jgi:hypothetical protein
MVTDWKTNSRKKELWQNLPRSFTYLFNKYFLSAYNMRNIDKIGLMGLCNCLECGLGGRALAIPWGQTCSLAFCLIFLHKPTTHISFKISSYAFFKIEYIDWAWWLTPAISASRKAEIKRIDVQAQAGQKFQIPFQPIKTEHLSS